HGMPSGKNETSTRPWLCAHPSRTPPPCSQAQRATITQSKVRPLLAGARGAAAATSSLIASTWLTSASSCPTAGHGCHSSITDPRLARRPDDRPLPPTREGGGPTLASEPAALPLVRVLWRGAEAAPLAWVRGVTKHGRLTALPGLLEEGVSRILIGHGQGS